jgi:hypothetical protein
VKVGEVLAVDLVGLQGREGWSTTLIHADQISLGSDLWVHTIPHRSKRLAINLQTGVTIRDQGEKTSGVPRKEGSKYQLLAA